MSYYRKPLAHGGHRLIARRGNGRFVRESLDCRVCECGQILMPTFTDEPFPIKVYPDTCHRCGADQTAKTGAQPAAILE